MYHSSIIEDIQWIPKASCTAKNFDMCLASLETNMQFQVWQMSQDFTEQEIDILHLAEYIDENELEWNNLNKSKNLKLI